jgi:hypothetical protein
VIIGATHLAGELIRPELHDAIEPAVAMPIYLVAGAWTAVATIRAAGSFLHGLVAGAILGFLPVALQLVGFGVILGHDSTAVTTAAIFGWLGVFWGGSLGSGIVRGGLADDNHG